LRDEAPGCDVRLFYPELLMQTDGRGIGT
jgi:hypothetical protein